MPPTDRQRRALGSIAMLRSNQTDELVMQALEGGAFAVVSVIVRRLRARHGGARQRISDTAVRRSLVRLIAEGRVERDVVPTRAPVPRYRYRLIREIDP